MITTTSAAVSTPLAMVRILFFICCGQLMVATLNTVEAKETKETQNRQGRANTQDWKEYPGKYHTTSDCPWGEMSSGHSLEACKERCDDSPECTAIDFANSGRMCYLVNCQDPATEPSGSNSGLTAYSIIDQPDGWNGPFIGKYFDTDQGCVDVNPFKSGLSLSECLSLCLVESTSDPGCNAISHRDIDGSCSRRACPSTVTEPQGDIPSFNTYRRKIVSQVWKEYPGKYYRPEDSCSVVVDSVGTSLETCKRKCADHTECTAVNFRHSDDYCRLVNCKDPAPEPTWSRSGWTVYSIIDQPEKKLHRSTSK